MVRKPLYSPTNIWSPLVSLSTPCHIQLNKFTFTNSMLHLLKNYANKMEESTSPNVTLENEEIREIMYFPCPVCQEMIEINYTKKLKPYLTCNDCSV